MGESNGSSSSNNDQRMMMMMIRKGPWKPEEDDVLLNHVRKYGPRDWSSIRSKGLLHRTGKSCRLRWVNKLRPNLKIGCKFTAEEERVVIELQAQLGNKWATIATHLPGRTDNDVKNFWSSRQKRLARILQSQSPSTTFHKSLNTNKSSSNSSSTTTATTGCSSKRPRTNSPKALKTCSLVEEPSTKRQRSSSSSPYSLDTNVNTMKPIPLPTVANSSYPVSEPNGNDIVKLEAIPLQEIPFPPVPSHLPFPLETQELIDRLDSTFFGPYGYPYGSSLLDYDDGASLMSCYGCGGDPIVGAVGGETDADIPVGPDSFFDDFPPDMFDQIEPLPSPSNW